MKKFSAWKVYLLGGTLIVVAILISVHTSPWTFGALPSKNLAIDLAPASAVAAQPSQQKIAGEPVRIIVPNRGIDLPVIRGSFNEQTGEWTLSSNKAQYATNSSVANNRGGNTFIYGHDIPQVFERLDGLAVGDIAQVITDNGYSFTYRFRSAIDVDPKNTSIFNYSGAPILTLQTCSGIWSETRRLMTFDFIEVQQV